MGLTEMFQKPFDHIRLVMDAAGLAGRVAALSVIQQIRCDQGKMFRQAVRHPGPVPAACGKTVDKQKGSRGLYP